MTLLNNKLIYVLDDIKRFNQSQYLDEKIKNKLDLYVDFNGNIFSNLNFSTDSIVNYFIQLPHKIVCIHSSFILNINSDSYILSSLIRGSILDSTTKYFIEFSGGTQSSVISERYLKAEVKTFYTNLHFFIETYLSENNVLPESLIFGKNYRLIPLLILYEKIKERFYFDRSTPIQNLKLINFIEESLKDYTELQNDVVKITTWISKNKNIEKADLLYIFEKWISEYI